MAESKVLSLKFRNTDDSTASLTVNDPKTDLTAAAVKEAMNAIIVENVFSIDGADLATPTGAVMTTKTETVIF